MQQTRNQKNVLPTFAGCSLHIIECIFYYEFNIHYQHQGFKKINKKWKMKWERKTSSLVLTKMSYNHNVIL